MFTEQISADLILFFILYGITGVVPLIAAIYLLLRRGNAFASDVTPPLRLRRWAASFFFVASLGHIWWYLFYIYSGDLHSAAYVAVVLLDCVLLLFTIAGTLLAMLQDRRRSVWPALIAMIPFVVLSVVQMIYPSYLLELISGIYILLLYLIFTIYMVVAVRRYGRWLNDNYADLENKKVWLSQLLTLCFMLLFILYIFVVNMFLIFIMHFVELVFFGLLLWRVETLPQLENIFVGQEKDSLTPETSQDSNTPAQAQLPLIIASNIEQRLAAHCVDTQLYLKHDLTLQQLAQAVRTNRTYLSQYFSSRDTTYNAYINDLRINHFMDLYREAIATKQSATAQELAIDSGYRSYSTFSLAFKQRMGLSVTAWMREMSK
ncbi:MAG: AraC family transcriptional regulator [Bacteroidaceae bacterium]|nr:AraC family transcriptional regulator [Bacteroidaceae bacterium]